MPPKEIGPAFQSEGRASIFPTRNDKWLVPKAATGRGRRICATIHRPSPALRALDRPAPARRQLQTAPGSRLILWRPLRSSGNLWGGGPETLSQEEQARGQPSG